MHVPASDMFWYWGDTKHVDVTTVIPSVPHLLTKKIQDVRKSQKKLTASTVAKNLATKDLAANDLSAN